jgi:histidinol-phosphate aminotransferase
MNTKPEILTTAPAHHGAFDYDELARLRLSPDDILDFSVNSNPYGPPPGVPEAIARIPLSRYPDRESLALRERLAELHNLSADQIVAGNGTAELLLLVALAFLQRGDSVLVVEPTFGEYERVSALLGATVIRQRIGLDAPDFDALADVIQRQQPKLVFWCFPNNPTGRADDIHVLIERFPGVLFIIDEAYIHFIEAPPEPAPRSPNVLILRSQTKDYALAGLRLGYAVGPTDLIEALRRVRPAWNVNALAQAAGLAILGQSAWLTETMRQLHADKRALVAGLERLGHPPLPSATHYFLLDVGNGAAFRQRLLAHQVMVRDCASFGLPAYVRIATRTPDDNARLLDAIAQVAHAR